MLRPCWFEDVSHGCCRPRPVRQHVACGCRVAGPRRGCPGRAGGGSRLPRGGRVRRRSDPGRSGVARRGHPRPCRCGADLPRGLSRHQIRGRRLSAFISPTVCGRRQRSRATWQAMGAATATHACSSPASPSPWGIQRSWRSTSRCYRTLIDLPRVGLFGYIELAGISVVILTFVFGAYVIASARARSLFRSTRAMRLLNRAGGTMMAGAAVVVATK